MNRKKIIDAILGSYRQHGTRNQEHVLQESLKYIGDLNLVALAQALGIDTDKVLEVVRS